MKYLRIVLCLMFVLSTPAKGAFVEGLEDFPIPEGLEQMENANLNFGNEDIRLVEAYMTSERLSFAQAVKFYKDTLPQLGWTMKKNSAKKISFEREKENVEISEESSNPLIINLTLKSKK